MEGKGIRDVSLDSHILIAGQDARQQEQQVGPGIYEDSSKCADQNQENFGGIQPNDNHVNDVISCRDISVAIGTQSSKRRRKSSKRFIQKGSTLGRVESDDNDSCRLESLRSNSESPVQLPQKDFSLKHPVSKQVGALNHNIFKSASFFDNSNMATQDGRAALVSPKVMHEPAGRPLAREQYVSGEVREEGSGETNQMFGDGKLAFLGGEPRLGDLSLSRIEANARGHGSQIDQFDNGDIEKQAAQRLQRHVKSMALQGALQRRKNNLGGHTGKLEATDSVVSTPNRSASQVESVSDSQTPQNDSIFQNSADSAAGSDDEPEPIVASFNQHGPDRFQATLEQDANIRERLGAYADLVAQLTQPSLYETGNEVVDVMLSHDATRLILLEQCSQERFNVLQFCAETFARKFTFTLTGYFIKAKDLAQARGRGTQSIFALPYLTENGFHVVVFNKTIKLLELDVSELLGLTDNIRPIDALPDPLINCVFEQSNNLFIVVYNTRSKRLTYFSYNLARRELVWNPVQICLSHEVINFPLRTFYDSSHQLLYIFFRHGQSLIVNPQNPKVAKQQKITDECVCQVLYCKGQVLIVVTSENIELYKLHREVDDYKTGMDDGSANGTPENRYKALFRGMAAGDRARHYSWVKYTSLGMKGLVSLVEKSDEFQVVTDALIHFYYLKFDDDSCMPILKNSMFNFMGCNQMLIDRGSTLCCTYKIGEPNLVLFKRKYNHGFRELVDRTSREFCSAAVLQRSNIFLISDDSTVYVHDERSFELRDKIQVPLVTSHTDDPIEIINIMISPKAKFLAILSGKNLVKSIEEMHFLHVYKIQYDAYSARSSASFQLVVEQELPSQLRLISKTFEFNIADEGRELMFIDSKKIIRYNYMTGAESVVYRFDNKLPSQPELMVFDDMQQKAIIASSDDALWVNLKEQEEVDIDEIYNISSIQAITFDPLEQKFYLLANKLERRLGYFVLVIDVERPQLGMKPKFLIRWLNKLEIGDAALNLINIEREGLNGKQQAKEIVVSQKNIYTNLYTIFVIDVRTGLTKFRIENHHLWEHEVKGFLTSNYDFIILNQEGLSFIPLGTQEKRSIHAEEGVERMVHSLQSCNYLKIEDSNHIYFEKPRKDERRIVSIQDQWKDGKDQTYFYDIYNFSIDEMTLRELVLLQSIFYCRSQANIVHLIEIQPDASLFFRCFMELDKSNMVTILSFDSQCIKVLLREDRVYDYPLFFKIRTRGPGGRRVGKTAIDIALENNQISAAQQVVDYITQHQNSFAFSFLFKENFVILLEKGINVRELLQSDIFCHQFEIEDWPIVHPDNSYVVMPFNDSIFQLRGKYGQVFNCLGEEAAEKNDKEEDGKLTKKHLSLGVSQTLQGSDLDKGPGASTKVYRIKYTLNLLPGAIVQQNTEEAHVSLMELLSSTEDLDIFDTKVVSDFVHFSWDNYASHVHFFGAFIHLIYVLAFFLYVHLVVQRRDYTLRSHLIIIMFISLLYPMLYDSLQLKRQGCRRYFEDFWNILDQAFVWLGIVNLVIQRTSRDIMAPHAIVIMLIVTLLLLMKTFFFLRVFSELTFLVTMLVQVFSDLRAFIFVYFVLVFKFALMLAIIDLGNSKLSPDPDVRNSLSGKTYPGIEYKHVNEFIAHLFSVIRISIGDFSFDQATQLSSFQNGLFWLVWFAVVIVTCIIFLNFIIAEVSASYQTVKDHIGVLMLQEKALLVAEAEDMLRARFGGDKMREWNHLFPQYIISREQED